MKSIITLLICLFISSNLVAQAPLKSYENLVMVYRVSPQAFDEKGKLKSKNIESYLTFIDSTYDIESFNKKLEKGIYYKTSSSFKIEEYYYISDLSPSFFKNKKGFLLILLNKNGETISNAKVYSKGKRLHYDTNLKGYQLPVNIDIVKVEVDGSTLYYNVKDKMSLKKVRKSSASDYFIVTNKPMYKLNDTLKVKYFDKKTIRLKQNKNDLRVTLNSFSEWHNDTTFLLKPYRPGFYEFEFPLNSFPFKLDENIFLNFYKKGKTYKTKYIPFTQYELKDLVLHLNINKRILNESDTLILDILAKDYNDLTLQDVEIQALVEIKEVVDVNPNIESIQYDDIVFDDKVIMDTKGNYVLKIPIDHLPKLNANYNIKITATNSSEQKITKVENFNTDFDLNFEVTEPSVNKMKVKVLNASEYNGEAELHFLDKNRETISIKKLDENHLYDVDSTVYFYNIVHNYKYYYLDRADFYPPNIQFDNNNDTLEVSVKSFVPFWYTIFKNKKVFTSGYAEGLLEKILFDEKDIYDVRIRYLNRQNIKNEEKSFAYTGDRLDIKIETPKFAFPGDTVLTSVTVKDSKGKPMPNMDITTWGIKSQFEKSTSPYIQNSTARTKLLSHSTKYSELKNWKYPRDIIESSYNKFNSYSSDHFVYEEDNPDKPAQLLISYRGKEYLVAILKNNIPVHSMIWSNAAIVSGKELNPNDSLLVVTNKSNYILYNVHVNEGKRKIISIKEKHIPNQNTLIKKDNSNLNYKPNYYKLSYRSREFESIYLRKENEYISLKNYIQLQRTNQYEMSFLYSYKLYDQLFYTRLGTKEIEVKNNFVKETIDYKYKAGYKDSRTSDPLDKFIYNFKNLEELHFERLLQRVSEPNDLYNGSLAITKATKGLKYVIVETKNTIKIYRKNFQIKKGDSANVYFYFKYDSILHTSVHLQKDKLYLNPQYNTTPIDTAQRNKLLSLLEMKSGFTSYKLELSKDYISGGLTKIYILDRYGNPIYGAIVSYGNYSSTTNFDGSVILNELPSALTVTALGYKTVKYIPGLDSPNIIFLENTEDELQEVVVVGYGVRSNSISNALSGRAAGVKLGSSPSIRIRGIATFSNSNQIFGSRAVSDEDLIAYVEGIEQGNKKNTDQDLNNPNFDDNNFVSYYNVRTRSSFKDDSYWLPKLTTDQNGELNFAYQLPDDITAWKNEFVITDGKNYFETYTSKLNVYLPLFTEIEYPKFALLGDQFQFTAKARQANDTEVKFIQQEVAVNGEMIYKSDTTITNLVSTSHQYKVTSTDSTNIIYNVYDNSKLLDGMSKKIPTYSVGMEKATQDFFHLNKDTSFVIDNSNKNKTIAIQNNFPQLIDDRLNMVIDYFYESNDQMASKLTALIWKKRLYELKGLKFKENNKINNYIKQLKTNQTEEGGWSWYGKYKPTEWITEHVYKALVLADSLKFAVDQSILDKTRSLARAWKENSENDRVIALKLLREQLSSKDISGGYSYKSTYHGLLFSTIFKVVYEPLESIIKEEKDVVYIPTKGYQHFDNLVMLNIALYDYLKLKKDPRANKVYEYLKSIFYSNQYLNNYQLSNLLNLIMPEILNQQVQTSNEFYINGNLIAFNDDGYFTQSFETEKIEVVYKGVAKTSFSAYTKEWDTTNTSYKEGYSVATSWTHNLNKGEEIKLVIKVKADKPADYVMLEIPIPAGLDYVSKPAAGYREYHRSYYDHQVVIFYEHLTAGEFEISFPLKARYPGKYQVNPAKISQQYFPAFFGSTGVERVNVYEK